MNMSKKSVIVAVIMFCYAGINFEGLFGYRTQYVQNITYIGRTLITLFGFLYFFIIQKNYKKNYKLNIYIIVLMFYCSTILSSIVNLNLTVDIFIKNTFALGLYFYLIYTSYDYKDLLKGLQLFYLLILWLNLITYFLIPEIGVYTLSYKGIPLLKGILTNRNSVILYTLPLITINGLLKDDFRRRVSYLIVNFISIIITLLTGSDTAVAVMLFYIVMKIIYKNRTININIYISSILIVFLAILLTNIEDNFLSYIINNILGSDLTLSGRTVVWDKVINLIPKAFIFGYGLGSFQIAESLFYKNATNGMPLNDPFNGILNIIFFNGVIGLILFFVIIKKALKRLNYIQKNDKRIISLILFFLSMFLISISESIFQFTSFTFWIFIILVYTYKTDGLLETWGVDETKKNGKIIIDKVRRDLECEYFIK